MSRKLKLGVIALLLTASGFAQAAGTETVDLLIKNGHILTINDQMEVIANGYVAVNDHKIVAVGGMKDLSAISAKKVLDVAGDIVMPGMINTHTHASMTVFRSLADDVADRLARYIFPLEAKFVSRDMVRIGADLANVEMVEGGVTTYADMYYFEDEVAKTVDKIGMRAVLGETVIKFPVADAKNADEGIAYGLKFIKEYRNHPLITPAFAPHAPTTNTAEALQKVARLSLELDVPVLIHLAETPEESEKIAKQTNGLTPVAYMDSIGALNQNLIAAHAIFVDANDIILLKKHDVKVAHNMGANIKSGKGVAPVPKMLAAGVTVGLGTDGPMSGNTISVMDQLSQVAKVHKLVNNDRTLMPPVEVVKMATIGGAKTLMLDKKVGSLVVGKQADLIVVNTKSSHMMPIYNPYSALVYSAYATDVRHSIIDGRLIMEDRRISTVDEGKIRQQAQEFSNTLRAYLVDKGEIVR